MVHGYIRNVCKILNQSQVETPKLILAICALFYIEKEFLSIIIHAGKPFEPDYNGNCILVGDDELTASVGDNCCGRTYGQAVIDSFE